MIREISIEQIANVELHLGNIKQIIELGKITNPNTKKRFTDEIKNCEDFISMFKYRFFMLGIKYSKGEMAMTVGDV